MLLLMTRVTVCNMISNNNTTTTVPLPPQRTEFSMIDGSASRPDPPILYSTVQYCNTVPTVCTTSAKPPYRLYMPDGMFIVRSKLRKRIYAAQQQSIESIESIESNRIHRAKSAKEKSRKASKSNGKQDGN